MFRLAAKGMLMDLLVFRWQITMQLFSGIGYVIWMSDATGVGTGGSSVVSQTGIDIAAISK